MKKKKRKMKKAQVFDFATRQLHLVPEAELVPGMVSCCFTGVADPVLVAPQDIAKLRDVPHRWAPFPESIKAVIQFIHTTLQAVYPLTMAQWENALRKDCNPDREMNAWIFVAMAYIRFTADRELTPEQQRDIFNVIFTWKYNPPERVDQLAVPTIARERKQEMAAALTAWETAAIPAEYEQYTRALDEYFAPLKGGRILMPADFK